MVIRLRRVRKIAGRILIFGTVIATIRGTAALIPLMQSVQIGAAKESDISHEDTQKTIGFSEHWMQYHFAEGIGISTNSAVTVESTTNKYLN